MEATKRVCTEEECDGAPIARGWCEKHYRRWRKYGDPKLLKYPGSTVQERLELRSRQSGECRLWAGGVSHNGYAYMVHKDRRRPVHVLAWELANEATVPTGMDVDHKCRVRHCIASDHLRLATRGENMQNSGGLRPGSSMYRGVRRSSGSAWESRVALDGVSYYLRSHPTERLAAAVASTARSLIMTHYIPSVEWTDEELAYAREAVMANDALACLIESRTSPESPAGVEAVSNL